MKKTIVLTGGGTAGHIYPNIAIAENLKNWNIHYIGSSGMEKDILSKFPSITFHEIPSVKFDRSHIYKNFLLPFKLLKSVKAAKKVLKEISPDIVFSKGGYVALPVARAAKSLAIPLITHESDLSLGLANKIISKWANVTLTTFSETAKSSRAVWTGQPLRKNILNGDKTKVLQKLGFPHKKIILFVGGSLGSVRMNELLTDPTYLTKDYVVIHSVGVNNIHSVQHSQDYFPYPFLDPIGDFYAAADLVVTRAGSGVINELATLKKPMLMLPLSKKASRGDQIENAKLFTKKGYGEMILDEDLTRERLSEKISNMIKNIDFYQNNLKKTANLDANSKIIELIEKLS